LAEKLLMHPNEGRRSMVTVVDDKLTFVDEELFPRHKNLMEMHQKTPAT